MEAKTQRLKSIRVFLTHKRKLSEINHMVSYKKKEFAIKKKSSMLRSMGTFGNELSFGTVITPCTS